MCHFREGVVYGTKNSIFASDSSQTENPIKVCTPGLTESRSSFLGTLWTRMAFKLILARLKLFNI